MRGHGVWVRVLDHVVDTLSLWTFSEPTHFMDFVCVLNHNINVLNRKMFLLLSVRSFLAFVKKSTELGVCLSTDICKKV